MPAEGRSELSEGLGLPCQVIPRIVGKRGLQSRPPFDKAISILGQEPVNAHHRGSLPIFRLPDVEALDLPEVCVRQDAAERSPETRANDRDRYRTSCHAECQRAGSYRTSTKDGESLGCCRSSTKAKHFYAQDPTDCRRSQQSRRDGHDNSSNDAHGNLPEAFEVQDLALEELRIVLERSDAALQALERPDGPAVLGAQVVIPPDTETRHLRTKPALKCPAAALRAHVRAALTEQGKPMPDEPVTRAAKTPRAPGFNSLLKHSQVESQIEVAFSCGAEPHPRIESFPAFRARHDRFLVLTPRHRD